MGLVRLEIVERRTDPTSGHNYRGIGVDRGRVGGIGARESSKEELAENREPKRLAFSEGETAIEPSVRKRGKKLIYIYIYSIYCIYYICICIQWTPA